MLLSARSLFRGVPPLAKGGCWSPTQRPRSSLELHVCPSFSPAPLGGPRDPPSLRAAPAQSRVGGGEEPLRGPLAWKPPARPGGAQHGHAPLRGQHNFSSPEVGFLQVSSVLGPTSRNLLVPARPGSPRAANRRPRTPPPPARPRPPRSPSPSPGCGSLANAPARSRAGSAAPKLVSAEGAGRPSSAVWFELGSAGGALWPRSLHPPGSPAGGSAAAVPGVTGWEPATPGAAAGWRARMNVEPFFIIERRAPEQAPLPRAPQSPAGNDGTRAAPTDGGDNRGGSPDFGARGLQARWASAGRREVPVSPPPPRAAAGIGGSASPGFPPPPGRPRAALTGRAGCRRSANAQSQSQSAARLMLPGPAAGARRAARVGAARRCADCAGLRVGSAGCATRGSLGRCPARGCPRRGLRGGRLQSALYCWSPLRLPRLPPAPLPPSSAL